MPIELRVIQPQTVVDPVCGMAVSPDTAAAKVTYEGHPYFFCSRGCAERFRAAPAQFLTPGAKPMAMAHAAAADADEYTCPMHPEIRQIGPGSCPICGMALEPVRISLEEPPNLELDDMTRRFRASLALSLPLVLLPMLWATPHWIELALAAPVVIWGGWPLFERGWASIRTWNLNMFTLIALGVGAAFGFSVIATVAPSLFPASFRTSGGVAVYFEPAAVIVTLVLLGQVLELRARARTGSAIRKLLGLTPKDAHRIDFDGTEEDIPLDLVHPGHRLRVKPGERVPVDGVVVSGTTHVDESMITGEPMPVAKQTGSPLTGGTVNGTGAVVMEARRVGADTLLAQIVRMVTEAQRSRAPIQRLADQVSGWFVPIVVASAAVTFGAWGLYGPEPRLAHALVNAVAVLIIACPCALGLATPMSIMVGTGRGAEHGILIRSAEALELFGRVTTIVLDKTGTLTEGRPALVAVAARGGFDDAALLRLAASLEQSSEHPLAAAIVAGARARGVAFGEVGDFQSTTGRGVAGTVDGRRVAIGNAAHLATMSIDLSPLQSQAEGWRRDGRTVMFAAVDGALAGMLGVADPIKAGAADAIRALRDEGLRIVMLTGDNRTTADAVARALGIDGVEADVLPDRKAAVVKTLQQAGERVAMAGDGINDSPALAQADVGIAMGNGTDIAIESAGITLVRGDLRGLVRARRLSRATLRNIRQNLFFAFVYNALGVPLAAGVLYPVVGLLLNPMIASAAMTFSSVSVIANALRLRHAAL